jgi:hypothetical protein
MTLIGFLWFYGSWSLTQRKIAQHSLRNNNMNDERFEVVFTGEILTAPEEFKSNLSRLYQVDMERLNRFFTGRPVILDRDADYDKAQKFKTVFERAGGVCLIRPKTEPPSYIAETKVISDIPWQGKGHSISFEFTGGLWGLFGYNLFFNLLASTILLLPIGLHVFLSWLTENTRLSDGRPMRFDGTIKQGYLGLLKCGLVIAVLAMAPVGAAIFLDPSLAGPVSIAITIIIVLFTFYVYFRVTHWVIRSIEIKDLGALMFQAKLSSCILWILILFLSCLLVITMPWGIHKFWKWLVENVQSYNGWKLSWKGSLLETYKRVIITGLASLLIIPIPWVQYWLFTYFVQNTEAKMER